MTVNRSDDFERYAAIAALCLLVLGCYLVVRPFLTAFLWGGIIAVSTTGLFGRILKLTGRRRGLAATITVVALAATLLVPIAVLALKVATRWPAVSERLSDFMSGGLDAPPSWVAEIPMMGAQASNYWESVAANPEQLAQDVRPLLSPVKDFLIAFSAGLGGGVLEFALALVIAGLLYVWGDDFGAAISRVIHRVGGESALRQVGVALSTVRGVFRGVLGTAAVQAILALIGFWIAGVPGVFVLGMTTFFLSVVPVGPAVLWVPAAIWLHVQGSDAWAVFIVVWGIVVVGGADNLVRPLLIGKGVEAPLPLIFIGVVGGVLSFGFLGMFIGPTLLAVVYNLLQDWMVRREA